MPNDIQFTRRRRRRSPVLPVLALTVVASLAVAGVWQLCSPTVSETEEIVFDPAIAEQYGIQQSDAGSDSASPEHESTADESASTSVSTESSAPIESESTAPAVSEAVSTEADSGATGLTYLSDARPVPEQAERVKSTYFDDAVFIGDSITTGITLYDVMSNAQVWASTGVGLSNVLTQQIATVDGVTMTVPEALRQTQPGKIYILLGANSLAASLDDVIAVYSSTLDTIISCAPDAIIYVQSAFPINEELYHVKYNTVVTNAIIDDFNSRLLKLCGEKGVNFLDINSYFRDETGGMPAEYTSDGLHIHSAQYLDWFDYLKTHAIQ